MRGGDDFDFWHLDEELYNAIRAAELAAEGAALRARAWAALVHRAALMLLGISLLLGIAMLTVPNLRPWYTQAVWVFLFGFACYLLMVAIIYWTRPAPAREVRELLDFRHRIAALHVRLQRRPGGRPNPVLIGRLDDAVKLLDSELIPTLQELVERRANFQRELRNYERGEIRTPAPEMLHRLQRMLERQNAAIDGCVQQAADAYATLIALLQVANDDDVGRRAQEWVADLNILHDSLRDVLYGDDDPAHGRAEAEGPDAEQPDPVADDAGPVEFEPAPSEAEPAQDQPVESNLAPAEAESDTGAQNVDEDFRRKVEDALNHVRDLGELADCELVGELPLTISAICRDRLNGRGGNPTSLEQAHALNEALRAAIERLTLGDEHGARPPGDRIQPHHVLTEQYLEGLSPRQIAIRHYTSESTVHRNRRRGVRAVTRELREREAAYGSGDHGPPRS